MVRDRVDEKGWQHHGVNEQWQQMKNMMELQCGPMPNVMAALPNVGGALCSTSQRLADAHY